MLAAFFSPTEMKAELRNNEMETEFSNLKVLKLYAVTPTKDRGHRPRSPQMSIQVRQNGHLFIFDDSLVGEIVELLFVSTDVYTSVIGDDGTVVIPDNFKGVYTMKLYIGDKAYSTEVEL